MSLGLYTIEDGVVTQATSTLAWAKWFETHLQDRVIVKTTFGDSDVSTVFLGIDHSFSAGATPLLFETMIFGGPYDQYTRRYCTLQEAQAGHDDTVQSLMHGFHPDGETNNATQEA